jgi:hypothetical protein
MHAGVGRPHDREAGHVSMIEAAGAWQWPAAQEVETVPLGTESKLPEKETHKGFRCNPKPRCPPLPIFRSRKIPVVLFRNSLQFNIWMKLHRRCFVALPPPQ